MGVEQIRAVVDTLGSIRNVLREAEAAGKAAIYGPLGLRLT